VVLNIRRVDDFVCDLPPLRFGFRNIGSVVTLRPPKANPGSDHQMRYYIQLLTNPSVAAAAKVPRTWPPPR